MYMHVMYGNVQLAKSQFVSILFNKTKAPHLLPPTTQKPNIHKLYE